MLKDRILGLLSLAGICASVVVSCLNGHVFAAEQPIVKSSDKPTWQIVMLLDPASSEVSSLALLDAATKSRDPVAAALLARFGSPDSISPLLPEARNHPSLRKPLVPNYGGEELKIPSLEQYINAFHPEDLLRRYVVLHFNSAERRDAALSLIDAKEARFLLFAEADTYGLQFAATPTDKYFSNTSAASTGAPLGPEAAYQWGMIASKFPEAWDRATGHGYVAVIDGGLRDENPAAATGFAEFADPQLHPDLKKAVRKRWSAAVGQSIPNGVYAGASTGLEHPEQHGTHVTGILAATVSVPGSPGPGTGVAGACWDCSVAMYRKTAPSQKPVSWPDDVTYVPLAQNLSAGVRRAVQHGMQTVSLSSANIDVPPNYCAVNAANPACVAFVLAQAYGVAMVAANGNEKNKAPMYGVAWPARDSRWIGVAGTQYSATDPKLWDNGYLPPFEAGSNTGVETAVAAPAKDILSTISLGIGGENYSTAIYCGDSYGPTQATSQGYGTCTGTSMSTPMVSGAVMLMRSANPLLTPADLKSILSSTAVPCKTAGGAVDSGCGPGQLNAGEAVKKALDFDHTPIRDTVINRTVPLMAAYSALMSNHFYTSVPQMMRAAINGTLVPRPLPVVQGASVVLLPKQTSAQLASCPTNNGPLAPCYNMPVLDVRSVLSNAVVADVALRLTRYSWDSSNNEIANSRLVEYSRSNGSGVIDKHIYTSGDAALVSTSVTIEILNFFGNQEDVVLYGPVGNSIPGGTGWFPSCNGLPPSESCISSSPLAIGSLFTTSKNPLGGSPLVPLYRMSVRCADTTNTTTGVNSNAICATSPAHVSHVYTATETFRTAMESAALSYALDGIEGYIYPPSMAQPAGTVKLCRKYDANRDDWVLFPGAGASGTDCSASSNAYTNSGNYSQCKGDASLQSVNCSSASSNDNWIGWIPALSYPAAVLPTSAGTKTIAGTITYSGSPLQGVTLGGPGATCTESDASGQYVCTVSTTYSGTITPTASSYAFQPAQRSYSNLTSDVAGEDYDAHDADIAILGWIVRPNNQGIGGVTLTAPGLSCSQSSYSGFYRCDGPWGWGGVLTPSPIPTWWFNPPSRYLGPSIQVSGYYDGFLGKRPTVKGAIKLASGAAITNVKILGAQDVNTSPNCYTISNGSYECTVEVGFTGTLTPQKTGCTFTPSSMSYSNVQGNQGMHNYTASATCPP